MSFIADLSCRTILDSRGNPTVEVDCLLEDGSVGRAAVPSGASTGAFEAVELRDGGDAWCGKGVENALNGIRETLVPELLGRDALDQEDIDQRMIEIDGTENKARLGANAILGVSMAVCRAAADCADLPLYRYLGGPSARRLPIPLMNVINGGAHADNTIDFQEFMLAPIGAPDFSTGLRWVVEIYHRLKAILSDRKLSVAVGDEGGFAPDLAGDEVVLDVLAEAVEASGYELGRDRQIAFALDVAATEFYRDGGYHLSTEEKPVSSEQLVDRYAQLVDKYPIISIEDGLDEDDWGAWKSLTDRVGSDVSLVGDDLYVTQEARLERGINEGSGNAILVKLNQVGTVSETLHTIERAKTAGFRVIVSHRSGETEDHFIADLAVATNAGWIKTGAPCRSDRNAKYNQLLRLESALGDSAIYGG